MDKRDLPVVPKEAHAGELKKPEDRGGFLVVTLRENDRILIGNDIEIVLRTQGRSRIAIKAPKNVQIQWKRVPRA